ncbi:MAG: hypothetical protein ACRD3E_19815, partial [Terriglobales bacterium]
VRPSGHPYDRKTTFTPEQFRWIAALRSHDAEFLVVDEGPGMSGSSFLSVGDALIEAGVERRRIRFVCSHEPDPDNLAAPDAAQRWRAFRAERISHRIPQLPDQAKEDCSGGEWRRWLYASEGNWPASWTHMERAKFLSSERRQIFKFLGHGRFGNTVAERARLLSETGFGPKLMGIAGGFAEYRVMQGRPAEATDLSCAVVERIADYCALRAVEFREQRGRSNLAEMVRFNFGQLMNGDVPELLQCDESGPAVICDGRMVPHEWILSDGGAVKTDGESHGDDHFFPGPCDIAWDLAGAAVEWNMDEEATDALLRRYQLRSGDDARSRLQSYRLAYAVFRAAYCSMAAYAMRGTAEEARLQRDVLRYKKIISGTRFESDSEPSQVPALIPISESA